MAMNISWKYRYVPEGQMMPDEMNRWALDAYIKVLPKDVTGMETFPVNFLYIVIATIVQKGTRNGGVPSVNDKFCCRAPVTSHGRFSNASNLFSNDLEELKSQVETEFNNLQHIFNSTRP